MAQRQVNLLLPELSVEHIVILRATASQRATAPGSNDAPPPFPAHSVGETSEIYACIYVSIHNRKHIINISIYEDH